MTKTEAEKIMESWGAERVGFNRVRSGVVVESIHVPTSPGRKGGLIGNQKRQTGWRHYKFD
jgi:hypothetical protein